MDTERRIFFIPPHPEHCQRVGLYCRVSTSKNEQLHSLSNQLSGLCRKTFHVPDWKIADIYLEIQSAKGGTKRSELDRLIRDCQNDQLDLVIIKDMTRLGRDTLEILEAYRSIKNAGVRVIFEMDGLDSNIETDEFMIAAIASMAQAENESRSENIRLGHQKRALDGTSKLYNRKCYGYMHDDQGELIPHPEQAKVVQRIFDWYLAGESVLGIAKLLEENKILSPRGKDTWPKRTIDMMLSNEKYYGDVILNNATPEGDRTKSQDNHLGIISREQFEAVQKEKARRSNIVWQDGEVKRAGRKYSSKIQDQEAPKQ